MGNRGVFIRGKIARELRKAAGFKPKEKRDYETWTIGTKKGMIYRIVPDKGVELVEKEVDCLVTECVSPERKIYQELKKKYRLFKNNEEVKLDFTSLPSKSEMDRIMDVAKEDIESITNKEENDDSSN